MSKFTRFQKILLGMIAFLLAFTLITNGKGSSIKSIVYDPIVMLKYSLFEQPIETITHWIDDFLSLRAVQQENDFLRNELSKSELYSALLESQAKEIEELKGLMNFEVSKEYKKVYAQIINRNPEVYNNQVTLNIGSAEGVQLDNAVISSTGLIGKIIEVNEHTSRVRLLTSQDQLSKVSVQIHVSNNKSIHGYLEEYDLQQSCYVVRLYSNTDEIKVDQSVTTSGVGGVFPSGLYVGKVSLVQELLNENGRILYVEPAADFSSFENVAVLCEVSK
ncbi:MAG: rod shape-determining protein MreC [Traorella sp.]